jgi:hypothetical protein
MSIQDYLEADDASNRAKPKQPEPVFRMNLEKGELEFTSQDEINPEDAHLLHRITADLGVPIPAGHRLVLVEATKNMAAWTREHTEQELAVTKPNWRYRFKVVKDDRILSAEQVEQVKEYILAVEPGEVSNRPLAEGDGSTFVVPLADFQIGKGCQGEGGTEVLIQRFQRQLTQLVLDYEASGATDILIVDVGDNSCEGEQNVASQIGTNDLQFTDQLVVWFRIFTKVVVELSKLCPGVVYVGGVPSNHSQHRKDGAPIGDPGNDYGLMTLRMVETSLALNPDAFSHVKFVRPQRQQESFSITVSNTTIGFAHGHQSNNPDKVPEYIMKQIAGRQPLEASDIVVTGHFHHLRVQSIIGNRWWFQAPANDAGSAWYTNRSGEFSSPGILTFTVKDGNWGNLRVVS